ncbi:MAG: type II toxin-antitoxin system VapC family toxin [Armatimonadetes bacterium]|nr:type II toxin-antitoxin system VapC family toxin [Armatimonadota bacterium]
MRHILVDTSAWAALADAKDPHHEIAVLFSEEIIGDTTLFVTDYILDELYTLLLMNIKYQHTVEFKRKLDVLQQAGILKVVKVSEVTLSEAWAVFEKYNVDKRWSYTDCVSYVVMKEIALEEAFAFDHHFIQMGFQCWP